MEPPREATQLLRQWRGGDRGALDALMGVLYRELRQIAALQLRGESSNTLQPTALVNEAYMRLVGMSRMDFNDRNHFLATTARVIRQTLVDMARRRNAAKRDGGDRLTLIEEVVGSPDGMTKPIDFDTMLLELDDLLSELAEIDEVAARVVELRVFGGLRIDQSADVLETSQATVSRKWRIAKAWLTRYFNERK